MTCRVIVFAKAPVPGYAKTRLAKTIGNQAAAELATLMLRAAVKQAVDAGLGPVELCCSPDTSHPEFAALQQQYGIELSLQGEGDLGQRMQRAFARSLNHNLDHPAQPDQLVLLTGTDAPGLDAAYLQNAAVVLARSQADGKPAPLAVFAPALDGGYAMIGLRQDLPLLFENMPWSTDAVMRLSRERLQQAGLNHAELAALADVDEAEDLIHLPPEWLNTPGLPGKASPSDAVQGQTHTPTQAQSQLPDPLPAKLPPSSHTSSEIQP